VPLHINTPTSAAVVLWFFTRVCFMFLVIDSVLDPSKLRTPCNGDFFTQHSRGGLAYAR
jgi:hypothetical protein